MAEFCKSDAFSARRRPFSELHAPWRRPATFDIKRIYNNVRMRAREEPFPLRERKKREKGPKKRSYGGGKSTSEVVFRGSEVVFSSSEVVFFNWACSLENGEVEKRYKGEAGGCASRREVF